MPGAEHRKVGRGTRERLYAGILIAALNWWGGLAAASPGEGSLATIDVVADRTPWAVAGARSWSRCREWSSEAQAERLTSVADTVVDDERHRWARRAVACPHALEILSLAARTELLRTFRLPTKTDADTDLTELNEGMVSSRARALTWIETIFVEASARRQAVPATLEYWRGKALVAQCQYDAADLAFSRSQRSSGVEPFRLRRMRALIALFRGDIETAQRESHRAQLDSPRGALRVVSNYIHALVLDRSGDEAAARVLMRRTLKMDRDRNSLYALLAVFPLHEHVYMRALQAEALRSGAMARRLWEAYLARDEPATPERHSAERHLAALKIEPRRL